MLSSVARVFFRVLDLLLKTSGQHRRVVVVVVVTGCGIGGVLSSMGVLSCGVYVQDFALVHGMLRVQQQSVSSAEDDTDQNNVLLE